MQKQKEVSQQKPQKAERKKYPKDLQLFQLGQTIYAPRQSWRQGPRRCSPRAKTALQKPQKPKVPNQTQTRSQIRLNKARSQQIELGRSEGLV